MPGNHGRRIQWMCQNLLWMLRSSTHFGRKQPGRLARRLAAFKLQCGADASFFLVSIFRHKTQMQTLKTRIKFQKSQNTS